jgi:hypothetical protein
MSKIQLKRGTSSRWIELNPLLTKGEPGYETDTGKLKIGDGISYWIDLPYFANVSSSINNEDIQDVIGDGFFVGGNGISLNYNDNANTLTIDNAAAAAVQWTTNHTLADGTRYLTNDVVYNNGYLYKANFDNESMPVTNTTYWTNIGSGYRLNIDGRDIPNIPTVDTGDITFNASTISTANTNQDLTLISNGTGDIYIGDSLSSINLITNSSSYAKTVSITTNSPSNTVTTSLQSGGSWGGTRPPGEIVISWGIGGISPINGTFIVDSIEYTITGYMYSEGDPVAFISFYPANDLEPYADTNITITYPSYVVSVPKTWEFSNNGNLQTPGSIIFPNNTTLAAGTFDNGTSGNNGISLNCAVGYELNWQGGHLKSTIDNGTTAANILCDSSLEFPGVGTSNMAIDAKGLTFPDGSIQVTSSDPMTKGPQINPRGMARVVTIKNADFFTAYISSTTGYVAARLWDGSIYLYGNGDSNATQYITFGIPESGNWSSSAPKEIFFWSCGSEESSAQYGDITWINVSDQNVTNLDISGLNALTHLFCANNLLTSLNLNGLTALTRLECNNNFLTALDISGLTELEIVFCYYNSIIERLNAREASSLTELRCQNNSITSLELSGTALEILNADNNSLVELDVSELTTLIQLMCSNNSLSLLKVNGLTSMTYLGCSNNSLTSLNVSGLTSLSYLNCNNNSLTSLNISGTPALFSLNCANNSIVSLNVSESLGLTVLYCNDNSITSLRAAGIGLGGGSSYTHGLIYGGDISDNSLSDEALNQFYSDLAASAGFLNVAGNPGISSDNPIIATAKGYTVYGS